MHFFNSATELVKNENDYNDSSFVFKFSIVYFLLLSFLFVVYSLFNLKFGP